MTEQSRIVTTMEDRTVLHCCRNVRSAFTGTFYMMERWWYLGAGERLVVTKPQLFYEMGDHRETVFQALCVDLF